jgi:hypothetical protein
LETGKERRAEVAAAGRTGVEWTGTGLGLSFVWTTTLPVNCHPHLGRYYEMGIPHKRSRATFSAKRTQSFEKFV